MQIFDKLLRKFGYEKASRLAELLSAIGSNMYEPTYGESIPENYGNNISAYGKEVWVYACVFLIANTMAGLPYRLFTWGKKKGKPEKEETTNDDFEALFDKPNPADPNSSRYNLIEWTAANLELIGNAYWLNNELYGTPARPKSLINLMSSNMRVVKGETAGLVKEYRLMKNNADFIAYKPEEITHFRYMSPDNYFYGQSSFGTCIHAIDIVKNAQITNLNIFKNGTIIDRVLETDQPLNDTTYKRLKEQFEQKYLGVANAHKTPIFEQGLKYKVITANMRDLEYISGTKLSREDICAAFGVPPLLVGILDQSSYSNYETALKLFYYFTIIPKLNRFNDTITRLVQKFDPKLFFEFDTSNEEVLKENEQQKATVAKIYFDMGVPFNEINQRLNLGFPDIEGGEVGYLPFNLQPVEMLLNPPELPELPPVQPLDGETPPPDDEAGKNKGKIKKIVYNKEKKALLWKQFDALTRAIERRYMHIIGVFFTGLQMQILRKLTAQKSVFKAANVDYFLFDEGDEIDNWKKQSRRIHEFTMKTNGDRELSNMGLGATFDVKNPRVVRFLNDYGLEKAKEIIGNARESVKQTLIQGIDAGEGIPELKKRIQEEFQPYTDAGYKAERIARTEVIGTSNRGAIESYRQADVGAMKAWLNQPDARDTHIEAGQRYNENNPIPLDENFQVGAGSGECPGNIGLPEEDINCRCAIIPVIKVE